MAEDGFYLGHQCAECGSFVPKVQYQEPDPEFGPEYDPQVDHVRKGFLQKPYVRISALLGAPPFAEMPAQDWDRIVAASTPAHLGWEEREGRDWWWYGGRIWETRERGISPDVFPVAADAWDAWMENRGASARQREEEDIRIELAEEQAAEERRKAKLAWADAKLSGESSRREPIPRDVRLEVFRRDGGRCVECGSDFDLQYDHIIPFSMGGSNSVANLQLLCGDCNRRKGGTLG